MGEIGQALKAVQSVRSAKESLVGSNGSGGDPGIQSPMQDPLQAMYPSGNGLSLAGLGTSQATPSPTQDPGPIPIGDPTPPAAPVPQASTPVDNPYTPYDNNPVEDISKTVGSNDSDIPVTGFKRTHESFIPRLMDTLLQLRGRQPIFQNRIDAADTERAMEGFTHDPLGTIQKIATINPDAAYKMYGQYVDDQRMQGNLGRQTEATQMVIENAARARAASMASTLSSAKDPQKAWPTLRSRIIDYGKAHDIDFSGELPEQYNDLDVQAFQNAGVSLPQKERIDQGNRKLDQADTRLQQTGADTESRIAHRASVDARGNTALTDREQARSDKQEHLIATPHGNMVVRGNRGAITTPDGMAHLFITNDGTHWTHINTIPTKAVKK